MRSCSFRADASLKIRKEFSTDPSSNVGDSDVPFLWKLLGSQIQYKKGVNPERAPGNRWGLGVRRREVLG